MVAGNITNDLEYMDQVSSWFVDIVQVASWHYNMVGLRSDGTAVAAFASFLEPIDVGYFDDIVQVESVEDNIIGITSKGLVVAAGADKEEFESWALTEYAEGYLQGAGTCY